MVEISEESPNNSILEVDPEYETTARGYRCRLHILVPSHDAQPGQPPHVRTGWEWIAKEDGAGFEEMGALNRQTGEWEADVDNDEKSGYTNALRRAAQDARGIGHYLYNKGLPGFLDPNNLPLDPCAPVITKVDDIVYIEQRLAIKQDPEKPALRDVDKADRLIKEKCDQAMREKIEKEALARCIDMNPARNSTRRSAFSRACRPSSRSPPGR